MPRGGKQKATAAYAASQPLFDVLRTGALRADEQKANLTSARDTVQQLHVKLPTSDAKVDERRYEQSIDSIVKAWQCATQTYADIFNSLAKVTAAAVAEGKSERQGHAEFVEMARTALIAKDAATEFVLFENLKQTHHEPSAPAAATSEADCNAAAAAASFVTKDTVPPDTETAKSSSTRLPPQGSRPERVKRKHGEPETLVERQSKKIRHESKALTTKGANHSRPLPDRRVPVQVQDETIPSLPQHATGQNGVTAPDSALQPNSELYQIPGVTYKDVSAEVEARLKAKEEKKAAAKKEKKRKRESSEFSGLKEADVKTERPKTKRMKSESTSGDADTSMKNEKRKMYERAVNEVIESETKKKRKKA